MYHDLLEPISTVLLEFLNTWRAFLQAYLGGKDPAAVGLEIGISRNAVYLASGRVLGRLREVLEGFLENEVL